MIVVPTVPHTGTHFMRELLQGHEIHLRHVYLDEIEELDELLAAGNPAIVPRRPTARVLTSWLKYDKDPRDFAGMSIDDWFKMQHVVLEGVDQVYYLNLEDAGIRDEQLAIINQELGLELTTDWKPVRQASDVQVH